MKAKKCLSFETLLVVMAVLIVSNLIIAWSVWTFLGMQMHGMQKNMLYAQKEYCVNQKKDYIKKDLEKQTQKDTVDQVQASVEVVE